MVFLLRSLCAVIGTAFLFAVANLVISGLPSDGPALSLASNAPPSAPGRLRDLSPPLLGEASSQAVSPIAPSAWRLT